MDIRENIMSNLLQVLSAVITGLLNWLTDLYNRAKLRRLETEQAARKKQEQAKNDISQVEVEINTKPKDDDAQGTITNPFGGWDE
jgi:hypothetical protein